MRPAISYAKSQRKHSICPSLSVPTHGDKRAGELRPGEEGHQIAYAGEMKGYIISDVDPNGEAEE